MVQIIYLGHFPNSIFIISPFLIHIHPLLLCILFLRQIFFFVFCPTSQSPPNFYVFFDASCSAQVHYLLITFTLLTPISLAPNLIPFIPSYCTSMMSGWGGSRDPTKTFGQSKSGGRNKNEDRRLAGCFVSMISHRLANIFSVIWVEISRNRLVTSSSGLSVIVSKLIAFQPLIWIIPENEKNLIGFIGKKIF